MIIFHQNLLLQPMRAGRKRNVLNVRVTCNFHNFKTSLNFLDDGNDIVSFFVWLLKLQRVLLISYVRDRRVLSIDYRSKSSSSSSKVFLRVYYKAIRNGRQFIFFRLSISLYIPPIALTVIFPDPPDDPPLPNPPP